MVISPLEESARSAVVCCSSGCDDFLHVIFVARAWSREAARGCPELVFLEYGVVFSGLCVMCRASIVQH